MDIRINHTWPKIGIKTQKAQLNLKNNAKTDHIISHTEPKVQISSTQPKVHIDQSQCFSEAGRKGVEDFTDECIQIGKQAVMEFIQRKSQQGDSFARIENRGRPVLDAVRQEMTKIVDYNVAMMPESKPDIFIEEGELDIQLIEGQVDVQYNHVPIEGEYIPGKIKFYMEQVGSVDVEYVGNNVDVKL